MVAMTISRESRIIDIRRFFEKSQRSNFIVCEKKTYIGKFRVQSVIELNIHTK